MASSVDIWVDEEWAIPTNFFSGLTLPKVKLCEFPIVSGKDSAYVWVGPNARPESEETRKLREQADW